MPDFLPDFFSIGDQPALDEVARTDQFLDALAERRPVRIDDSDGPDFRALTTMLEDWRDNLRWPPASALVSPEEAIGALQDGMANRRRARRGMRAVGSVAASLLVLSGFGAMVVEARPGETLYGLHAMFFDQPKVNKNQVPVAAKADLAKVQQLIDEGQWDQAASQLAAVSSMVQSMNDGVDRAELQNQLTLMNVRIESRNPSATLPPPPESTAPSWSTPTSTAPRVAPTTSQPGSSAGAASSQAPGPAPSSAPSSSSGRHRNPGASAAPITPSASP